MPYMHQDITNTNYKDTNLGRQEYVAWKKSIPLETLNTDCIGSCDVSPYPIGTSGIKI
jgi:hypothetical protein